MNPDLFCLDVSSAAKSFSLAKITSSTREPTLARNPIRCSSIQMRDNFVSPWTFVAQNICNALFFRSQLLNVSKLPMFNCQCQLCGKCFSRSYHLKRHSDNVHKYAPGSLICIQQTDMHLSNKYAPAYMNLEPTKHICTS